MPGKLIHKQQTLRYEALEDYNLHIKRIWNYIASVLITYHEICMASYSYNFTLGSATGNTYDFIVDYHITVGSLCDF